MNLDIAIIGAGHGGLYAAALLSEAGNKVTVYEKNSYENISFDRTDCIERKFFREMGIVPPESSYASYPCTFVGPFTEAGLLIYTPDKDRDITVERRDFAHMLIEKAKLSGTEFVFDCEVSDIIVKGEKVVGIRIGEKEIFADLVIDASGFLSKFKASLPPLCGIQKAPEGKEIFNVFHASYKFREGVKAPEGKDVWKLYLKYLGKSSISWVNCERENEAAVLVGMIGDMSKDDFDELFTALKKDNPIVGEELMRGGEFAPISVRYPSSVMVCDGYALIGDSAFMTIPIMGSGLGNAIRAGKMLADAIISAQDTSVQTLWNYQTEYFKKIGAISCVIDAVKRALLKLPDAELRYIFESDAITDEDVKNILAGDIGSFLKSGVMSKLKRLAPAKASFKLLFSDVSKGLKAAALCFAMPKKYDLVAVNAFARKLDGIFKTI